MMSKKCEICSSLNVSRVEVREGLEYQMCQSCDHCLLVTQYDSLQALFDISQEKYFGEKTVLLNTCQSPPEKEILETRCGIFNRFVKSPMSILEVGPGAGAFLQWACGQGHRFTAIEYSPELANVLASKTSAKLIIEDFASNILPSSSQDVFCSFHVIEHVPNPREHLAEAARITRPGGLAFLATPNSKSWQQRFFRKLSPNFDSAHLRVFSPKSLGKLANDSGWKIVHFETPDPISGWLRVLSKAIRKMRGEDEEATAGKYSSMSSRTRLVFYAAKILSWPFRAIQSRLKGGNEIFYVLTKD